jgi:hypothetical protein
MEKNKGEEFLPQSRITFAKDKEESAFGVSLVYDPQIKTRLQ